MSKNISRVGFTNSDARDILLGLPNDKVDALVLEVEAEADKLAKARRERRKARREARKAAQTTQAAPAKPVRTITELTIQDAGAFTYKNAAGIVCKATFALFLIDRARTAGCDFEDLADGFGEGQGTQGDWSGIRDSSERAIEAMLERSMNYFRLA